MDYRVEPPPWLPEGAAPEAADEVTVNGSAQADSQAEGPGEDGSLNGVDSSGAGKPTDSAVADSAGADSPVADGAGGHEWDAAGQDSLTGDEEFPYGGQEPPSGEADSLTYGHAGSYVYGQGSPYEYRQESPDAAEYAADSGYNHGVMSQPGGEESPVPPYPAEVPSQPATPSVGKSAFATAAYRALPKPKFKPKFKPKPAARPRGAAKPGGQATPARRANLVVARFEPWSVMKFSFLMSLVAWVVLFVAVAVLYYVLSGIGVFAAIQKTLESVTSSQGSAGVNLSKWTSASRILGYTMLIGAVNIVLITALTTVGAVIYNLVTHLGGGIEVTLRETD